MSNAQPTTDDLRALEIRVAQAIGFTVQRGALYAPLPNPTLLGGDYRVTLGSQPETAELVEQLWTWYTPRFARSLDDAMLLLDLIYERHHLDYNLFRDNDGRHTCEIGRWADEAGKLDELWQATEDSAALAIVNAIAACPFIMQEPRFE